MPRPSLLRVAGAVVLVPVLVPVLLLGAGPASAQEAPSGQVPVLPTSEPSPEPPPSPEPAPEPEPSPEPEPAPPSPSRAAPSPARTAAPPPSPAEEPDDEPGEEVVVPAPVESSDLPFAEVPSSPSPTASPLPTEPVADDEPSDTDPLTRLVQLAVGGALLLGAVGVTGLYLTRERPEEDL